MKNSTMKAGGFPVISRLFFALLFSIFLYPGLLTAGGGKVQDLLSKRVSISANHVQVKSVFSNIERQTGVKFLYSSSNIRPDQRVSLTVEKEALSVALERLLSPLQLTYMVSDKHIVIRRISNALEDKSGEMVPQTSAIVGSDWAVADKVVKGTVKDPSQNGLPGVSVVVKGTQRGTITDVNGDFSLSVDEENPTLVFSFVGYVTQEIALGGRTEIFVELKEDTKSLEELVVVGYGVQSKRNVTSSIASVSSDEISNQPVQQVGQALQGKVAGVQVVQNSGSPGSSLTVRIRGAGTINNSDPLYVIDGNLGGNPAGIDPSQIENIEILKSASAAAIYGAQGANGVVIITTKKGKSGKPVIQLNAYTGVQQVYRTLPLVNGRQYAELYNTALVNGGKAPLFTDLNGLGEGTDWQNEIFRTAPISNVELSASGGGEKGTFYTSAGYFSQDGTVIKSGYDRLSFRLNSEYRISPKVKIGENIGLVYGDRRPIPEFGSRDIIPSAWHMDPTVPVKTSDGKWGFPKFSDTKNPVAQAHYYHNKVKDYLLNSSGYLEADLFKNLTFRTQINFNLGFTRQDIYTPVYDVFPLQRNLVSSLEYRGTEFSNWDWQNTLNYQQYFGEHSLEVLAGVTALSYKSRSITAGGQGLPDNASIDESLRYLDLTTSGFSARGGAGDYGMLSYLGRINYGFRDKYLFTGNLRVDGSSRFGENNRYGVFPSFSLGWRISDEDFLKDVSWINDLKLRGGWGMLGNQNSLSNYAFANTLTPNLVYTFGDNISQGQAATSVGNPDLKWEAIKETEIGLDFAGLSNKLFVSAAYYVKKTSNMLLRAPIPAFTGITTAPFVNGGNVENKGVELVATFKDRTNGGLGYEISANIAKNKNEVTKLLNDQSILFSGTYSIAKVGAPIGAFYGYVMDGIFQTQAEVDNHAYQATGTAPGDIRFRDVNGDNVINQDDRAIIGNPWPKFNYGFSGNLSWKRFDLNALFYGVAGSEVVANWKYFTQGSNFYNFDQEMLNAWNGPGTSNTIPKLNVNDPNTNSRASSYFVEKGDYLRLRNLQVGYEILNGSSGKGGKLRAYLSCQNLLTFTSYKGFDPEIGKPDSSFRIGVDEGYYPQPRVITLGINASF